MKKDDFYLMDEAGDITGGSGTGVNPTIAERLAAPSGSFTEPVSEGEGAGANQTPDKVDFSPSPYWDVVKDVEGFTMPTDLTADNEMELLRPYVAKKFGIEAPAAAAPVELHPYTKMVDDYVKQNPNATVTDVSKVFTGNFIDPESMSSDELIRYNLVKKYGMYDEVNNKDGITEDDINTYLEKLDKIQRRDYADTIKASIIADNEKAKKDFEVTQQAQHEKAYNEYIQEVEKTTKEMLVKMNNVSDIYGIKFGQPELTAYMDEFKEALIPDKQTGVRKIDELLSNDEMLFKMFVFLYKKGEDGVREHMTQNREDIKKDLFQRLQITPQEGNQGTRVNINSPEELRGRLGSPAGSYN